MALTGTDPSATLTMETVAIITPLCQERSFMFSPKLAPVLAGLMMGTFMSFIMSGVVTAVNTGFDGGFPVRWMVAWSVAWCLAVPLATIGSFVIPGLVKRLVAAPISEPGGTTNPRTSA